VERETASTRSRPRGEDHPTASLLEPPAHDNNGGKKAAASVGLMNKGIFPQAAERKLPVRNVGENALMREGIRLPREERRSRL